MVTRAEIYAREQGLPVFRGRDGWRECWGRWGLPVTVGLAGPMSYLTGKDDDERATLFVDDDQGGKPMAVWVREGGEA